jgi:transposase
MPQTRRYPPELRERAVRMVLELNERGAVARVAEQLGMPSETLRKWVVRAQTDQGLRSGLTSDQLAELKELRKENTELRRANEILKAASAFFAKELDRPRTR